MTRTITIGMLAAAVILMTAGGIFYYQELRGIGPALRQPPADIAELIDEGDGENEDEFSKDDEVPPGENATNFPLTLQPGFRIETYTRNLSGARVMAWDMRGNLWVSRTSEGIVTMLDIENGKVVAQKNIFKGLRKPHGLAFDPTNPRMLYIAEEGRIIRAEVYRDAPVFAPGKQSDLDAVEGTLNTSALLRGIEELVGLPTDGGHYTRTIAFGPDDRLYVSIGSSCNVCNEDDERRAKIFTMKRDGSDFKEFATGLRNTVFFTWNYVDGRMWGTDMGRDLLGDDTPPDEINILKEGNNYGWPICYGQNIHDQAFDKNTYIRNPCVEPFEIGSAVDIPAHSAPLGLAFVPEEGWPDEYWYNLLVAYHGSWNRSVPTGYKVVRHKFNAKGEYLGAEDFISGWLTSKGALGRPVDISVQPGGAMYVSDDKAGVIYRVTFQR